MPTARFIYTQSEPIRAAFSVSTGAIKDHNKLINRDLDDQHPISAITGLQDALDAKQDVISDLSEIRSGAALGATAVQSVTEGTANGTIKVDGNSVSVHGLGSAAYTASTAYDASGSASTAETNAKNYADGLASNYATAAQGALADTAVQPSDLATVATTGSYDDLIDKPTIPTVNNATLTIQKNGVDVQTFTANASTNATANITVPTDTGDLTNNAGFITGITSGDVTTALGYTPYSDANPNGYTSNVGTVTSVNNTSPDSNGNVSLSIPAAQIQSDWTQADNTKVDYIKNKPNLATVATSGAYSDLSGTPSLATVATSGSYTDLSNKPTIPTVNNATISFTQGGVSKGSITLNQATDQTIAFDAGGGGGSTYTAGTGIDITNDVISVAAPTLTNTATGTDSLTILGTVGSGIKSVNIGELSSSARNGVAIGYQAQNTGSYNVCVGYNSSNSVNLGYSVALGGGAKTTAAYAIQLGYGTNSEANSFYVSTSNSNNWKMLGSDGLIPAARIAIDGTSITINGSGQLQASGGGGGGSYTAGDGIIIQNDEISVDAEATNEVDVEVTAEVTISDLLKLITGYDANATQTLKNINGSFQWVTD